MPTVINNSGVKAGCIYRIKLVNFVTYKEVELFPGLSLNMIIGPNGTGKSTFVSALILGLCGNIASIGRATKISEYVRSGCDEAIIEIDLYQETGQPNVKITRVFNKNDISKWYINNKPVAQKNVKDLISKFDIEVDNLCQLLPQDRVKDFAKMKPHTLLQRTLSAVGQQKRVEQLEKLKEFRADQYRLDNRVQKNEKRRQDLMKENEILQGRIDTLNRRKEIDKEIQVCNCKRLWLEESDLRAKCQSFDREKKSAEKLVKLNATKMRPIETSVEKVKNDIKELEAKKRSMNTVVTQLNDQIGESLRSVKTQNEKIREAQSWYKEIEEGQANEAKELEIAKANLDRLQVNLAQALKKYGDENTMNVQLNDLRKTMGDLERKKYGLMQKKDREQYEFEHNVFPEMARCRSRITALEDVSKKRLQTLQRYSADACEALRWLRANLAQFSGHVCEPMMLEIKFPDRRYARYLEATVARRDLVAFTFEKAEDMNLFLQRVRKEQGLKQVNAVCSPSSKTSYESPDINLISNFGFRTYLIDTFEAHPSIVNYLCKSYAVHRIPVGDERTYNSSGSVPADIALFFSENHRFSVRVSKYSGDRSTSMTEIQTPFLLSDAVDVDRISQMRQHLSSLEKQEQAYLNKKQAIDAELAEVEREYQSYDSKRSSLQGYMAKLRELRMKIRSQEAAVRERSRPSVDLREEREKCETSQREFVAKQIRLHRELTSVAASVHEQRAAMALLSLALKRTRSSLVDRQKELFDLQSELKEAKEALNKINQSQAVASQAADAKLAEAMKCSEGRRPGEPRFPLQAVYDKLPSDVKQLREHCDELIARIDCMSRGDEGDLRTYEENKKQIEQLMAEEEAAKNDNRKLESRVARIRLEWLEYVRQLVEDINVRFRDMFARLGFSGEVRLDHGTSEEDFGSYGVAIMVKFRAGEPLRELTPHEQSGGERAVCTCVYLLALQRVARAPFRCVDEINQGMDSQNERKMFEFLVSITTAADQGQYFLLTPKLLTGLEYNSNIVVHTIMNGRGAMNYKEWQIDSFIDKAASYRL